MRRRTATASIVASPVLVGAVTVLVVIVAVFLAYNANRGLPFVPSYDVTIELPGGANLVEGNDVRTGGFRIGLVEKIRSGVDRKTRRAVALVDVKLDKTIEPLPVDTRVVVRPRSALGLKYIELTLGNSRRNFRAGDVIPLENASTRVELDEFFGIFTSEMRRNQRTSFEGYGTALAGRGRSLNRVIEQLVPFVTHLEPVFRTLSHPDTRLARFFIESRRFAGQVAPVAYVYADLFSNMATTFEALSRYPDRLRQTIERAPLTLQAGIASFPVQRPFLADAEILFRRLEPVAAEMQRAFPKLSRALHVGTPVLGRAPALYVRTAAVLAALRDLAANPATLGALEDLTATFAVLAPLIEFIAPYQTVCSYWNYYWTGIGEHISEPTQGGTVQRVQIKTDDRNQDNRLGDSTSDRPVDLRKSADPQEERGATGTPLQALHSQSYGPAIDAQGRADCQTGQRGYLNRLLTGGRYPPSEDGIPNTGEVTKGGGTHVVLDSDTPGLAGGTYVSDKNGIDSLDDVP
jgi:virulence factor Mce-like protein